MNDNEVKVACYSVLRQFRGDCVYTSPEGKKYVLNGPDETTLKLVGIDKWEEIFDSQ